MVSACFVGKWSEGRSADACHIALLLVGVPFAVAVLGDSKADAGTLAWAIQIIDETVTYFFRAL